MFAHFATVSVLFILAAATAVPRGGTTDSPASQCNTGDLECCNSVQTATSSAVSTLALLHSINLGSVSGLAGLNCNPITAIGVGGTSCSAQPVCCTGNNYNGLIVLGCTPVNLNL